MMTFEVKAKKNLFKIAVEMIVILALVMCPLKMESVLMSLCVMTMMIAIGK